MFICYLIDFWFKRDLLSHSMMPKHILKTDRTQVLFLTYSSLFKCKILLHDLFFSLSHTSGIPYDKCSLQLILCVLKNCMIKLKIGRAFQWHVKIRLTFKFGIWITVLKSLPRDYKYFGFQYVQPFQVSSRISLRPVQWSQKI